MYSHPLFYKLSFPECDEYALRGIKNGYPIHFLKSSEETCFPGDFLRASIIVFNGAIKIRVDDGDDGEMEKYFPTLYRALSGMLELGAIEPFSLRDLTTIGYNQ